MSVATAHGVLPPRDFYFVRGPFLRALSKLHLRRRDGAPRATLLVAITWVPLLVGGVLLPFLAGKPAHSILHDISVHARLVGTIPLMVLAERLLSKRCWGSVKLLYEGEFADRAKLDRIFDSAERMRDSYAALFVMAVLAILSGQGPLWGVVGPTGVFSGLATAGDITFSRVWFGVVSQPLMVFLMLRWCWHWLIWSHAVIRVACLKLSTIALHPDRCGGLSFMSAPVNAFAVFLMAIATTLSSAWMTRILDGRATYQTFIPDFVTLLIIAVVVACGPCFAYLPMLDRERVVSFYKYNLLALDYTRDFQTKWVDGPGAKKLRVPALLGTPDIQSLNDLMGAYEGLKQIRPVPFGTKSVLYLWGAAALPMVPLAGTAMPMDEIMQRLGKMLLGFVA